MVAELVPFEDGYHRMPYFPWSRLTARELPAEWDSMEAIVDLLIDWDLLTAVITIDELGEWLDVSRMRCEAALEQLAGLPGVHIMNLDSARDHVLITVDTDTCPLTAAPGTV